MPVDRNRGIPTPTVAHEGNPRSNSLVVSGTLDGEAFIHFIPPDVITATPPEPSTPPPSTGGDCSDCTSIIPSTINQAMIDVCASDTGDGCVVTCPGDYSFDPTFYQAACENYYGAYRFGQNAPFDNPTVPAYYTTSPTLWNPAKGYVALDSSCAGRITRQIAFDWRAQQFGSHVDYTEVTPASFQTQVIDDWNSTGAHGQRCIASPDGAANIDVTCGGYLDCRFLFLTSGSGYYIQVYGEYASELNTPVSGIVVLTDDGSNPKITGYGLIVNRVNGMLETVQWNNGITNSYTVLNAYSYSPTAGDQLTLRIWQKCPCPYGSTDAGVIHTAFPKGGYIQSYTLISGQFSATNEYVSGTPTIDDEVGSVAPATWQALAYGGLLAAQVDGSCNNIAVWRNTFVMFTAPSTTC